MTEYHATYYAHELCRRHSLNDSEKLAPALADAQLDLNPHQLDAAFDEVNFGTSIPAGAYAMTKEPIDAHRYQIGHPLAQKLIAECKKMKPGGTTLVFDYTKWPQKAENFEPLVGRSGFLTVFQLSINGSDEQDHLIISAVSDTGEILPERSARRFFDLQVTEISPGLTQSDADATKKAFEKHFSRQDGVSFNPSNSMGLNQKGKNMATEKMIEFLGIWEEIYNPDFNSPEFEGIKNQGAKS